MLKRSGLVETWNFRQIEAGDDWRKVIDAQLNDAAVILLLVSASFLASDYCWEVEMTQALKRHDRGEAVVIPIILRDCDWHAAPFARLQALPDGGKAVTRSRPRDSGWATVVAGIRKTIESLSQHRSAGPTAPPSMVKVTNNLKTESLQAVTQARAVPQKHDQQQQHPKIVFTGDAGTDFDHHIFQFSVYINGELRWCEIAQETVRNFYNLGSGARHDEVWSVFQSNRKAIEAAAYAAIVSYKFGPDGRIHVGMKELAVVD